MTTAISKLPPQTMPNVEGVPARALGPTDSAVLAGKSATLVLTEIGTFELLLNRKLVLRDLGLDDATVLNGEQNGVTLERTLSGGLQERSFVPLRQAAAVWQWRATQPTEVHVRWKWAQAGSSVEAFSGAVLHSGDTILLSDRDALWQSDGLAASLTARLAAGEALTLVIVDGRGAAAANSIRALENVAALVQSRTADWKRAQDEKIHVSGSAKNWADRVNAATYALQSSGTDPVALDIAPGLEQSAQLVRELRDLLGFAPDPEKQRVALAPKIPEQWTSLTVRNLPIGEADTISLRYDRSGTTHMFVVAQESGAFPPRLIFEPAVPAQDVSSVTVDGVLADLNVRRAGDRTVVPVQLVLDHERTVVIVTE
jgi:hypothetical protein